MESNTHYDQRKKKGLVTINNHILYNRNNGIASLKFGSNLA